MYTIVVKSGTNGYSDYDNCDTVLAKIPSGNIPRVGDVLEFGDKSNSKKKKYLVREVKYVINHKNKEHDFEEWIYVYVINC